MPIRFIEEHRDMPPVDLHVVQLPAMHWREITARAAEITEWLNDPINAAEGAYTTAVKHINVTTRNRSIVYYFDNVDTALQFKLRWA